MEFAKKKASAVGEDFMQLLASSSWVEFEGHADGSRQEKAARQSILLMSSVEQPASLKPI